MLLMFPPGWGRRGRILPFRRQSSEAELNLKTELPEGQFYPEQVREAREAGRATGYKVKWRIGWAQVIGLLVMAAVVAGIMLLYQHNWPTICPHLPWTAGQCPP